MKNLLSMSILAGSLLLGYSVKAAVPVVFDLGHTINRGGYANRGCFIDEDRFIYKYEVQSGKPIKKVGRVGKKEFARAKELLGKASSGDFEEMRGSFDGGTSTWLGNLKGTKVILKKEGDFFGMNSAAETIELISLMDGWCR